MAVMAHRQFFDDSKRKMPSSLSVREYCCTIPDSSRRHTHRWPHNSSGMSSFSKSSSTEKLPGARCIGSMPASRSKPKSRLCEGSWRLMAWLSSLCSASVAGRNLTVVGWSKAFSRASMVMPGTGSSCTAGLLPPHTGGSPSGMAAMSSSVMSKSLRSVRTLSSSSSSSSQS